MHFFADFRAASQPVLDLVNKEQREKMWKKVQKGFV